MDNKMEDGSDILQSDLLVIGAGPGGYVAAIRAAQLGIKVTVLEPDRVGGICLNHGCIPSKALIHAANHAYQASHLDHLGIHLDGIRVDFPALMAWKTGVVDTLVGGIEDLFKRHKIDLIRGKARFVSNREVEVSGNDLVRKIAFQRVIVATGSVPTEIPGLAFDRKVVITSTEALALPEVPENLVVVGGGYIGLELGTLYAKLGSRVTVVEMMDQILPGMDKALILPVKKRLGELGITIHTRTRALGLEEEGGQPVLMAGCEGGENPLPIPADKILVAVGRRPETADLNLERTAITLDRQGFIVVDESMRTADGQILAIGDVTGQPLLAHKASRQGKVAAEICAGLPSRFDNRAIPAVVFTDPEMAVVGISEAQAKAAGREVVAGKFPFQALSRARAADAPAGFVKVVADRESGVVLGAQVVGADASSCIAEAALAVEKELRLEDLAHTIHAHPTFPEAIEEAAEAARGHAIHQFAIPRC